MGSSKRLVELDGDAYDALVAVIALADTCPELLLGETTDSLPAEPFALLLEEKEEESPGVTITDVGDGWESCKSFNCLCTCICKIPAADEALGEGGTLMEGKILERVRGVGYE